ncbi:MAG TPA: acetate--CoA ligase, partial [bacterium]|nr:acetate--CoA ligase [bacterium]
METRANVIWPPIPKALQPGEPPPNLSDYDSFRAGFDWSRARALLDGLPGGGGLNIAFEAVDRHARGAAAGRTAIRWIGKRGEREEISYADLFARTNRVANALGVLGIK